MKNSRYLLIFLSLFATACNTKAGGYSTFVDYDYKKAMEQSAYVCKESEDTSSLYEVSLGLYPQTLVNDEEIVAKLEEKYPVIRDGQNDSPIWKNYDNKFYVDMSTKGIKLEKEWISRGGYIVDITDLPKRVWFACEPIQFYRSGSSTAYFSRNILDNQVMMSLDYSKRLYDYSYAPSSVYEQSDLKVWVENYFSTSFRFLPMTFPSISYELPSTYDSYFYTLNLGYVTDYARFRGVSWDERGYGYFMTKENCWLQTSYYVDEETEEMTVTYYLEQLLLNRAGERKFVSQQTEAGYLPVLNFRDPEKKN